MCVHNSVPYWLKPNPKIYLPELGDKRKVGGERLLAIDPIHPTYPTPSNVCTSMDRELRC